MKLYHHPLSTFSRRIRMQLSEKGVSIDEAIVDMPKREHKGQDYLALNPYGRVPVLVDGELVLYESSAIMEYLEAMFPDPPLLPASAQGRARVAMHVKLCDLELTSHTRALFFPRRFLPRERWDMAAQDQAIQVITKHLGVLAEQLGDRTYLVDDRFTLAEVAYAPFMELLPMIGVEPAPNLAAWIARIEDRPSAQVWRASR